MIEAGPAAFAPGTDADMMKMFIPGRCCPELAHTGGDYGQRQIRQTRTVARPNAFVIVGETVLERLHQVAQRIRENIEQILARDETRQQK
jgi:hypothetical protein